jgi:hypothetical protein
MLASVDFSSINYGKAAQDAFQTVFGTMKSVADMQRQKKMQDLLLPMEMRKTETEIAVMEANAARTTALTEATRQRARQESELFNFMGETMHEEDPFDSIFTANSFIEPPAGQVADDEFPTQNPLYPMAFPSRDTKEALFGDLPPKEKLRERMEQRHQEGPDVIGGQPLLDEFGGTDDLQQGDWLSEGLPSAPGQAEPLIPTGYSQQPESTESSWDALAQKETAIKRTMAERQAGLSRIKNPQARAMRKQVLTQQFNNAMSRLDEERGGLLNSQLAQLPQEVQEQIINDASRTGSVLKSYRDYLSAQQRSAGSATTAKAEAFTPRALQIIQEQSSLQERLRNVDLTPERRQQFEARLAETDRELLVEQGRADAAQASTPAWVAEYQTLEQEAAPLRRDLKNDLIEKGDKKRLEELALQQYTLITRNAADVDNADAMEKFMRGEMNTPYAFVKGNFVELVTERGVPKLRLLTQKGKSPQHSWGQPARDKDGRQQFVTPSFEDIAENENKEPPSPGFMESAKEEFVPVSEGLGAKIVKAPAKLVKGFEQWSISHWERELSKELEKIDSLKEEMKTDNLSAERRRRLSVDHNSRVAKAEAIREAVKAAKARTNQ